MAKDDAENKRVDPQDSDACPDLEDLAAFADGRLTKEESRSIAQHLERCDRCSDLLAETISLLRLEQEADRASGGDVRSIEAFRGRRGGWSTPRRWIQVAAAIVLPVVAIYVLFPTRPYAELDPVRTQLAGRALHEVDSDWQFVGWGTMRGVSIDVQEAQAHFRFGAHLAVLQLGVLEADEGLCASAANAMRLLQSDGAALLVATSFAGDVVTAADAGDWSAAAEALELVESAEASDLYQPYLEAGRWARLADVATRLEATAHFTSRSWKRGLTSLRELEEGVEANVVDQLSELDPDAHARRASLLSEVFRQLGG